MSTSSQPSQISLSPYVGPQPFQREQQTLFFGRTKETNDLFSLVTAHGEVLLYAQSGAGKTSLLNAGLIPLLETRGFDVLPPARIGGPLPQERRVADIKNVYVFNILRTWAVPDQPAEELAGMTFRYFVENRVTKHDARGNAKPTVMILDQFEEVFQYYPDQWQTRKDLFDQIGDALGRHLQLRIVFAMREDYLAQLAPFCRYLPEQLNIRFRLEQLKKNAALAAVNGPLRSSSRSFGPGVAEKLVQELLKERVVDPGQETIEIVGEHVEPVQLQVVCDRLWQELPPEVAVISEDHLKNFGGVTQSLSKFYDGCIEKAAQETGVKEGALRNWFDRRLITASGTRGTVIREPKSSGGIPNEALDWLVKLHLIRMEQRAGAGWYELNHDRFIEPVQKSNQAWLLKQGPTLQMRCAFEQEAAAWVQAGRPGAGLLVGAELREAEQALKGADAVGVPCAPELIELVTVSRYEQDRIAAEQLRRANEARSRELATASLRNTAVDPDLALLLALESDCAMSTPESLEALHHVVLSCRTKRILARHTGPVFGVAFSPDGTILATAGDDAAVWLWGTESGRDIRKLEGHQGAIYGLAFSPDGTQLATASKDGSLKIWDVPSGAVRLTLAGHSKPVVGVAFGPDGRRLASAGFDGAAKIWDAEDGRELVELRGHAGPVIGVVLSPDGRMAATASMDGTVRLWDAASGQQCETCMRHGGPAYRLCFDPAGERLATSSLDQTARIWDVKTGRLLQTLSGHAAMLGMIAFSPDGKRVATASADGTARVWDSSTGRTLLTLVGHKGPVFGVAFSPGGETLATGSFDKTARIWALSTGYELAGHVGEIKDLAFSPDGSRLATAGVDGSAKLWDLSTGRELLTLTGHESLVYDVDISPDGGWIATGSLDGSVRIWDSRTGSLFAVLPNHVPIFGVRFAPDRRSIATAGAYGTVKLWTIPDQRLVRAFEGHSDLVYEVAFCGNGTRLVTASADGTARIWETGSGRELMCLRGHSGMVLSVSFSPDGGKVATAGSDSTARVWSAESGKELLILDRHASAVNSIAFDRTGSRLATASSDRTARVWDASTGECLLTLPGHKGIVNGVAFSPTDGRLATAGVEGCVHLHVLDTAELKRVAGACAVRGFTPDERARYHITTPAASVFPAA